jgi:molybdenum cofactor cytidylyltransferase
VGEVFVVTGAYRDRCLAELQGSSGAWTEIYNPDHSCGMGRSFKTALSWLISQRPELSAVIVTVCDQLFLEASHLRAIRSRAHDGHAWHLTASRYQEGWGVPALIPQAYFAESLEISDHKGAKELLMRYQSSLAWIDFFKGMNDIDTLSDVEIHGLQLGL